MSWRPDLDLVRLAALVVGGRRWWLLPLLPLLWLGFLAATSVVTGGEDFTASGAQGLIALPLTLLAIFLGLRIIAGEIDSRSLEIAYTVPGGCERVWWAKLVASLLILLTSETLLAVVTYVFFTPFAWSALYGALQAALFYMILAMGMATLVRGEAGGAMAVAVILSFNWLVSGLGGDRENQVRLSPFWNPHALENADPTELFAWTLQNRIGMILAMAALLSLAFMRANRRERMLGG